MFMAKFIGSFLKDFRKWSNRKFYFFHQPGMMIAQLEACPICKEVDLRLNLTSSLFLKISKTILPFLLIKEKHIFVF